MKQLLAGVVLIFVVGVGAFLYRNAVERPYTPEATACTLDAKVCPDGSAVGRTGPSCSFAPCAFPNAEIPDKNVSFVVPQGYTPDAQAYGADASLIAAFKKPAPAGSHFLVVRSYPIAEGETGEEVILAHTRYQPQDMQPTSLDTFGSVLVNGKTFRSTIIERFEGQVHSAYYLARANDVLVFEITEQSVSNWMDANLVAENLPEHKALLSLLGTLQVGE
ncbi:hypothetical protein KKD81_02290 [Patescibacteria group bacterium]|nr:hypothetical protein [Patescibacteria group bacterium]MBU2158729.1 hypothetical protein [Patescibacteria group bacterium]MBU2220745.1 hypothetical protein [Patescibacteria group bacterium]